jgi:hypothetical protein
MEPFASSVQPDGPVWMSVSRPEESTVATAIMRSPTAVPTGTGHVTVEAKDQRVRCADAPRTRAPEPVSAGGAGQRVIWCPAFVVLAALVIAGAPEAVTPAA